MSIKEELKKANLSRLKAKCIREQEQMKREAYNVGYAGKRLPHFSTLGEDSQQEDFESAIRVHVIDKDNEAPQSKFDAAERMIMPALREYVRGLKDGCREKGNSPVIDLGCQFNRRVAAKQGIKVK